MDSINYVHAASDQKYGLRRTLKIALNGYSPLTTANADDAARGNALDEIALST